MREVVNQEGMFKVARDDRIPVFILRQYLIVHLSSTHNGAVCILSGKTV